MSTLNDILRDFNSDVERAEHLLLLVKNFREFGASQVPSEVSDGTAAWPAALSLIEASKLRRTDLPILSGSILLYLSGRFEFFIRQVVETAADEIASKFTRYSDLPQSLRSELRARLLDIAQNPRRYGFDESQADAMLASLTDNQRGTGSALSINSNVLSITEANMKDRILTDLMKRIGMSEFWRDLGKQAQIKLHLEKTTDGEATAEAIMRLNNIMDDRNQIAHPTSATQFPDPDQVLKNAEFLRVVSSVTVVIVQVHLTSFRTATAPNP